MKRIISLTLSIALLGTSGMQAGFAQVGRSVVTAVAKHPFVTAGVALGTLGTTAATMYWVKAKKSTKKGLKFGTAKVRYENTEGITTLKLQFKDACAKKEEVKAQKALTTLICKCGKDVTVNMGKSSVKATAYYKTTIGKDFVPATMSLRKKALIGGAFGATAVAAVYALRPSLPAVKNAIWAGARFCGRNIARGGRGLVKWALRTPKNAQ